ncbi:hypothetical protein QOZ88_02015 [Blastococcus sp. BMG 814]|uniref:Uncharacterized protein n=1 Tax=Blastococcus carthaginiensis TaxID=3050034 RepID=A0ABT9I769_9ACTN|nr:hypothetical protein [Blastococcus carthaginiensis]MDP5181403.1 hypothetical protein [Blastococcus carthaginiensis]
MGRHEAPEGASPHPLVAAALAGRPAEAAGGHRHEPRAAAEEGDLGWPGDEPAPGGGGLGWPGDAAAEQQVQATLPPVPAEVPPRRGWRRLFGAAPAA